MIRSPIFPLCALRRLANDRDGTTVVEFAMVGPVLIMMIMGLFDIAHTQYTGSVLNGALQKAGRDLTLESAMSRQTNIDGRVRDQVASVMPNDAQITFVKDAYFDFSDVKDPEQILGDDAVGATGYGVCEGSKGERYVDTNNNDTYDLDRGADGIGGARDVVLYTANVTYPRMFPLYSMIGLPSNVTISATTVLRNQPYDEQNDRITAENPCP